MNDRDATADWLLSTQGRIARIVAGSLLIIIGLGIIGAIPIASAAYGTLLVGPLQEARTEDLRAEGVSTDEPSA